MRAGGTAEHPADQLDERLEVRLDVHVLLEMQFIYFWQVVVESCNHQADRAWLYRLGQGVLIPIGS